MRRRTSAVRNDPAEGLPLFADMPAVGAGDEAMGAWSSRITTWCDERGVDEIGLWALATERGLAEQRWDVP